MEIYETLQAMAVGLEMVVLDQTKAMSVFASEFDRAQDILKSLLCEVSSLIHECKFKKREDVPRSILPQSDRQEQNQTFRDLMHFLIFRDYLNALEYTEQVFKHLRSRSCYNE